MALFIETDLREYDQFARQFHDRRSEPDNLLRNASAFFARVVLDHFEEQKHGDRFGANYSRGTSWKDFAPQRVRQDGTVVPAWGGVPWARDPSRITLGRKRPSGRRVTIRSKLIQDSNRIVDTIGRFAFAGGQGRDAQGRFSNRVGISIIWSLNIPYAGFQEEMRHFWYVTEGELEQLGEMYIESVFEVGSGQARGLVSRIARPRSGGA